MVYSFISHIHVLWSTSTTTVTVIILLFSLITPVCRKFIPRNYQMVERSNDKGTGEEVRGRGGRENP